MTRDTRAGHFFIDEDYHIYHIIAPAPWGVIAHALLPPSFSGLAD